MVLAPGKRVGEHLWERPSRVDRARIDVEQRALLREPSRALGVALLLSEQVEDIGRVPGVEHAEACGQAEHRGMPAHVVMRDRMKRSAEHPAAIGGRGY